MLVRSWRQKFASVPKTVLKDELEALPERTVDQESIEAVFTAVNSVYKDVRFTFVCPPRFHFIHNYRMRGMSSITY